MKYAKEITSWHPRIAAFFVSHTGKKLLEDIEAAYRTGTIFPPPHDIFHAYRRTAFDAVRVIIVGQDPYHQPGQAHGLAFSVPENTPLPPSLRNILKEIYTNDPMPRSGDLRYLADQGVLLLNTYLTVPQGCALGHKNIGWQACTELVIQTLSQEREHLVFMLWGAHAQSYIPHIHNTNRHLILTAPHPSPLSAHRGFIGCNHFALANEYLEKNDTGKIMWQKKII